MFWRCRLASAVLALLTLPAGPAFAETAPGQWTSGRGGPSSDGAASLRLGWTRPPEVVGSLDLNVDMPLDYRSVLAVPGRGVDSLVFVSDGAALAAYDTKGRQAWRTGHVGVGELLDVADLDGDGRTELLFSALHRLQFDYNAATGPGRLLVLDAHTGNILWTYRFDGLEFGFSRRRTLVTSVDGGRTRSIFGVLTYSPSLWRIDFDRHSGGRVTWRSEPFAYTSPDAAPHAVDLDGDGRLEVMVDSNGQAYAVNVQTGGIVGADTYTDHHTFFGFIGSVATSDGPLVFDLANSVYGKTAAAFRYEKGHGLRRLWSRTWDSGLGLPTTDLSSVHALVHVNGRSFAVWSSAAAGSPDSAHLVEAVDPATGAVAFSARLGRLVDVLDTGAPQVVLVTTESGAVRFTRLTAGGFEHLERMEAATWLSASRARPPSQLASQPWSSAGLLRRTTGLPLVARVTGARFDLHQVDVPATQGREHVAVAELPDGSIVLSGGGVGLAVGASGVRRLFAAAGPLWATPLLGQLDDDAGIEVLVPYGNANARVDFSARHAAAVTPFPGRTIPQERETFHIPALAAGHTSDAPAIVGYEYADDDAKLLVGRHSTGAERWRVPLDQSAGEFSIVAARPRPDGRVAIFQHDNHGTQAIDASTGAVIWTKPRIGQCQRQIAAIDWNDDGVDDAVVESGDIALVLDGRDGTPLFERPLAASYGAYVAVARDAAGAPVAAMINAGGLGLFDARDVHFDAQVQPRGLEMIPLVVGPWGAGRRAHLFMATGSGLLSVLDLRGRAMATRATGLQVLTVTGALVDGDDVMDLLVSTLQGELVALSGRTLTELWRIGLGGLGGPAVATDVDGDGTPEIVVVSSSGRLLVIAPRLVDDAPATAAGDTDGDGMTDQDEQRFGLAVDVPDAHLDADGDGIPNGVEVATGTHPRGLWTAYLPGGVTSDFFRTTIAIANPSMTDQARVLVRLQTSTGEPVARLLQLPPHSRKTLRVAEHFPDYAHAEFGTVVESDLPVAVDGTQAWGTPEYGAIAERGITGGPATTWYLAEGATHSGFDLFYMIQNPGNRDAELAITFLRAAGQVPVVWRGVVEAGRRFTLHVNRVLGLASSEVAGVVTSQNGVPVLVERSMFLSTGGRLFQAGHESSAVRAPSTQWLLAEGATGPYFDTFVLIANPSENDAVVDVTYLRPAGAPVVQRHLIPASTRLTVWVDHADPVLADTAVSTRVDSVNGVGIVAERSMWWPGTSWHEGHGSAGETEPGVEWAFGEGEAGGPTAAETYLLIANSTAAPATIRLRLLFEDGATAERIYTIPARSRANVAIQDEFVESVGRRFGGHVESLGSDPVPVSVERAMYWDGAGTRWKAGTAALATRLR